MEKPAVQVRRAYEEPTPGDGTRVLVDRLWPRGLSKEKADLDEWCKSVAPSTALRKWYDHDPERFEEFTRRPGDLTTVVGAAGVLCRPRRGVTPTGIRRRPTRSPSAILPNDLPRVAVSNAIG